MNKISKVAAAGAVAVSLSLGGLVAISAPASAAEVRATTSTKAKITTQPKSTSVVVGKVAKFTVKAKGTSLKYQWYSKKSGSSKWVKATGSTAKKSIYKVKATTKNSGTQFRVVVSNKLGSTKSKSVKLTVQTKPKITSQPKSFSATAGQSKNLTVAAKGNSLKYQWQQGNSAGWSNISGANAATYKFKVKSGATKYRVIVKNAAGKATSSQVTVTGVVAPKITQSPVTTTVALGSSTTLSVKATGTPLKYQWQTYDYDTERWNNVTGATKSTLTVKGTEKSQIDRFRVVVSNSLGSKVSDVAYVVVISSASAPFAPETVVTTTEYGFMVTQTYTNDLSDGTSQTYAGVAYCYMNSDYSGLPWMDLDVWYVGTDGYYYDHGGWYVDGDIWDTDIVYDGDCDTFIATALVPTNAVYGGSWYIYDRYAIAPFDELYIQGAVSPIPW